MLIDEIIRGRAYPWLASKTGQINTRLVVLITGLISLVLFWDTVLPWLGHLAHVLIEVLEMSLEHLLEHAFGLSPRSAQMVLAWTAFFLAIYLLVLLVRKIRDYCRKLISALALRWNRINESMGQKWLDHSWAKAAVVVGAMGAALYLFS